MTTKDYFIIAGLLFIFSGFLDRSLDLLDECYKSHTDYCVEQPDYKP